MITGFATRRLIGRDGGKCFVIATFVVAADKPADLLVQILVIHAGPGISGQDRLVSRTSEKTVKTQRSQVMKKMHADSLADLVRLAVKVGIKTTADQAL